MKPRVLLAFTLYGHVAPLCTLSMLSTTVQGLASGLVGHVEGTVNAFLDLARNDMCRKAIELDATHLWFVDQDMVLPAGALEALMSRELPVVGGLYFSKDRLDPVAFELDPLRRYDEVSQTDDGRPVRVGGIGLGCALIEVEVLRKLAVHSDSPDWFSSERDGEDIHFAKRCARWGIPIYLDTTVVCGHIRDEVVTLAHHRAMVERRKAAPRGATIGG